MCMYLPLWISVLTSLTPFHWQVEYMCIHYCYYIGLLDPRWIESQRRQLQEKKNEEAFSEGVQVLCLLHIGICSFLVV